jgi:hypothetical protein
MMGSIYFLQKNYNESLSWYEKSLKGDPSNQDSLMMVAHIEKLIGRSPAKGNSP